MHAGMRDLNRLLGPGILRLGEMLTHGKISDEDANHNWKLNRGGNWAKHENNWGDVLKVSWASPFLEDLSLCNCSIASKNAEFLFLYFHSLVDKE